MKTYTLITGASSGIGLELAKVFAEKKHNLILVARRKERLVALKKEIQQTNPVSIEILVKDLSNENQIKELYEEIKERKVLVDVLVNNAGFGELSYFINQKEKTIRDMISVNVLTLTLLSNVFAKDMAKRKKGHILNVSSIAGFQPGPLFSVYVATKAYVLHFTESIAEELKEKGIVVTSLCPGPTHSEFAEVSHMSNAAFFKGKLPSSRDVAEYGYKALYKKKIVAVHGFKNKILVFFSRLLPRSLIRKVSYAILK